MNPFSRERFCMSGCSGSRRSRSHSRGARDDRAAAWRARSGGRTTAGRACGSVKGSSVHERERLGARVGRRGATGRADGVRCDDGARARETVRPPRGARVSACARADWRSTPRRHRVAGASMRGLNSQTRVAGYSIPMTTTFDTDLFTADKLLEAKANDYVRYIGALVETTRLDGGGIMAPHRAVKGFLEKWPRSLHLDLFTKAATNPGATLEPAWGAPLAALRPLSEGFVSFTRGPSLEGQLFAAGARRVPFQSRCPCKRAPGRMRGSGKARPRRSAISNWPA